KPASQPYYFQPGLAFDDLGKDRKTAPPEDRKVLKDLAAQQLQNPNGPADSRKLVAGLTPGRGDTSDLDIPIKATPRTIIIRTGGQDATQAYTDLESRPRAARTMEQRLLEIIKSGKGEIKDLLLAEKELGVWRTKIEEYEGEKRYYDNLVSLSTLTITLVEKE